MAEISVPEDINPKPFFEEFVPEQFKVQIAENPVEGVEGTEFSMQLDIDGPNGGTWSIIVTDGKKMVVKPEPYDGALLTLQLNESDWRDAVTGKAGFDTQFDRRMDGDQAKAQLNVLKNIKGKLINEIIKEDGSIFRVNIIFNKNETPQTTIRIKMADMQDMQTGKLDGPNAFMQGKIQIEGDMMFAMQLGQLQF